MKIALIGYGKMGKTLEKVALLRGHHIILKIGVNNAEDFNRLSEVDVAIEFTRPESAVSNLTACIEAGVPVVCGTTGWLDKIDSIKSLCNMRESALLYASNYSIGMNIFFEVNKQLAKIMNTYDMYDVNIEEIHHTQKLDAPSGTAITLADDIMKNIDKKQKWVCNTEGSASDLLITAKRIDPAPGTHIVSYESPIDTINITHTAHSREGFAIGAIIGAEWLVGRKGVFSMKDVLGF